MILNWCDFDRASSLICGNKMPTRCNRWFLLQILLLAQYVLGIMVPETCWSSNKVCNKNHLLLLVDILFPHISDTKIEAWTHFVATRLSKQPFGCSRKTFRITVNLMCLSATSSKCCFRPSLAEPIVSSILQPSGAPRYQCGPAPWHNTISKTVACLPKPNRNLTSRPDTREGGGEHNNTYTHTKNRKHILNYAVTPRK